MRCGVLLILTIEDRKDDKGVWLKKIWKYGMIDSIWIFDKEKWMEVLE